MALDGDRLGDAILAAIDAAVAAAPEGEIPDRRAWCRGIGAAIVAEIVDHMSVSLAPNGKVAGVQAGGATLPLGGSATVT